MSSQAALNTNNRRYIAYRPCPEMQGQDQKELYDGIYRMLSHVATHASLSAVRKYIEYGEHETRVQYPGQGLPATWVILVAATIMVRACASVERWLGTTPAINRAIHDRLNDLEAFGLPSAWES